MIALFIYLVRSMKQTMISLVACVLIVSFVGYVMAQYDDPEFGLAVDWMHQHNMTKYQSIENYHPNEWVTREQAARLLGQYALTVQEMDTTTTPGACDFTDLDEADTTLVPYMKSACAVGIFKGSQGKFLPGAPLTKAQALAVLVRILVGPQDDHMQPWRKDYFTQAQKHQLTKETSVWGVDRPVTRYELALMIYRAEHGMTSPDQRELAEIQQLLLELGLRTQ